MKIKKAQHLSVCLLICLLTGIFSGCGVVVRGLGKGADHVWRSQILRQGRFGPLSETEKQWAAAAWKYFENNYNPQTGLYNSVDGYKTATLWHMGDSLAALIAARELELIPVCDFDKRLSELLHFLNTMDLFYGKLPNKMYNTEEGSTDILKTQKHKEATQENKEEIGWSATDIGRLLIWLRILKTRYPEYAEYADRAVLRWNFCDLIDSCGTLYGGIKAADGSVRTFQEGRLGYEEYAAKGFQLWGFDTQMASRFEPFETVRIYNYDIPYDRRTQREGDSIAPVMSHTFMLDGMEFNWDQAKDNYPGLDSVHTDSQMAKLAKSIYKVQETRFLEEHIFTARTDYRVQEEPFQIFSTIFAEGYPWNVLTANGEYQKNAALVSTKAAFGMWVLWETPYTDKLMNLMQCLHDSQQGWYEGRFEQTGGYLKSLTIETNAAVLEALLYKAKGKLFPGNTKPGFYENTITDSFKREGKCFPPEMKPCAEDTGL